MAVRPFYGNLGTWVNKTIREAEGAKRNRVRGKGLGQVKQSREQHGNSKSIGEFPGRAFLLQTGAASTVAIPVNEKSTPVAREASPVVIDMMNGVGTG